MKQANQEEAPVEIDTKAMRLKIHEGGIRQEVEILALCDVVDRLRAKLDAGNNLCKKAQEHIEKVVAENATLTKEVDRSHSAIVSLTGEVARLKGEKVCKACGVPTHEKTVRMEVTYPGTGILRQEWVIENACPDCIDRALDALRGK